MGVIELDGEYSSIVNFAMQHNYVPVIKNLKIKNIKDVPIENITIKISTDPVFSYDWSTTINAIEPEETVEIDNVNVKLSQSFLYSVTERINGIIKISVFNNEECIEEQIKEISVLAFDEWNGYLYIPEIISAFVTPNNDYVISVIKNACKILDEWTSSPSFTGYQTKNPNIVRKQIAAIYEALKQENIAYSNPPASFEAIGQKVRMADSVLKQKIGTCLDLTLLYAACLEYVGINPIIIFIKGHAFLGCWLEEESFSESMQDDFSLITKRIADGVNEICVVECTSFVSGSNLSFEQAVSTAEKHFLCPENFVMFIDVLRSRAGGIKPLPIAVRKINNEIEFQDTEIKSVKDNVREFVILDVDVEKTAEKYTKQQMWERKLLDMNLRNTLLNFRVTKNSLQLISGDLGHLEDALADGEEFTILPQSADFNNTLRNGKIYEIENKESMIDKLLANEFKYKRLRTFLGENELNKQIKTLYRSAKNSLEENGANTLYLALGFLKWYETDRSERARYAPLVLWPVELIRKSAKHGYVIRVRDEEPQFNITLLEMLKSDYGINIGGLDPLPADESGIDMLKVFTIMRKAVMHKKNWDVEELAFVGIFSFNHFIMWNDIHNRSEDLKKNKIVLSLISGKMEWTAAETFLSPKILDERFSPLDIAVPVSADSSQMSAICLSGMDSSFVLHGPPGTGKSQTITNMIANALYHGKTILFIAEKMAALSVVQKRLEAIGLGPFCLELHSNKAKKKDVLEQLDKALNVGRIKSPDDYKNQAEKIYELRKNLNEIVNEIHRVHKFGFSLYDAISRSEQYSEYPCEVVFTNNDIDNLSKERYEHWIQLCEKTAIIAEECGGIYENPLKEIQLCEYSQSVRNDIIKILDEFSDILNNYKELIKKCESRVGCRIDKEEKALAFKNLCTAIADSGKIPQTLVGNNDIEMFREQVIDTCLQGRKRDVSEKELLSFFDDRIFEYDYKSAEREWHEADTKWFLPKWIKQNKIYKILKTYTVSGALEKGDVLNKFKEMRQHEEHCKSVEATKDIFEKLFGMIYNGGKCNWDTLEHLYKTAVEINSLTGTVADGNKNTILKNISEMIDNQNIDIFMDYISLHEKFETCEKELSRLARIDFSELNKTDDYANIIAQKVSVWKDNIYNLRNWCAYNSIKAEIISLGLGSLIDYIETNEKCDIMPVLYKSLYQACALWIIDQNKCLSSFNGVMLKKDIATYREYCDDFEMMTRNELAARLSANIPTVSSGVSAASEMGILQKAIKSGGRMTSIRKLFDSIPNLLKKLCPCMLMSPISVAQYIDPDYPKFDLVIFDEASQMPTCEAVGAIARGKNLVVVGDPKQLPPTSFFSSNRIDEDNIEQEDMESILDDCLALSMPQEHLLWHYRSRHESLIAFSNRKYYENKLYTFPSPYDQVSKVSHVSVKGYYDRGKTKQNKAEAIAIVQEIERRLQDPVLSKQSIGVVTFSIVQQNLINDMIDDLFSKHPEYEEASKKTGEELFVKNLENVQGDERDIIMFSIGYGPDENGKVALNFGPLNRDGGWRRLNVAVSRARKEMIVYSVLRPEQIDLTRTRSEGVAGIKAFLEFAIYGTKALSVRSENGNVNKDILVPIIANKIKELGYEVNTDIGCSEYKVDIGVVHPKDKDKYILGIIVDGMNYASTGTARDRTIVQESVLKSLGWQISHIWSLDWFEDSDKELQRIKSEIDAETGKKRNDTETGNIKKSPVSFQKIETPFQHNLTYYTPCELNKINATADEFVQPEYTVIIRSQIMQVMNKEAPISKSLLRKRLIDAWGITRAGSRINRRIDELLCSMQIYRVSYGDEEFLYDVRPTDYKKFRVPSDDISKRAIEDIAPEEMASAIKYIMDMQISIDEEELYKEVAKLFGFARCTAQMKQTICIGIKKAVELNYIKNENARIVIV